MAWQPRRWLGGILIPVALWILALVINAPRVADDIETRTKAALQSSGLSWVEASAAGGRDVALRGTAPDQVSLSRAENVAAATWGVRRVEQASLTLLSEVKPYSWSAERLQDTVDLRGFVPTFEVKAQVLGAVRAAFPDLKITDQLVLGRGAPSGFTDAAIAALASLGRLTAGTVDISDYRLSIRGQAKDFASLDSLTTSFATFPAGFNLESPEIQPPRISPFLWEVLWRDSHLTITGVVPDAAAKTQLTARVTQDFPGSALDDASRPAKGAPDGDWLAAARFALDQLARLKSGTVRLSDSRLVISGEGTAGYGNAQLASAATALPLGYILAPGSITTPEIHPYVLTLEKKGTGWSFSGYAPSEAAKVLLAGNIRATGATSVDDRSLVAPGMPTGFDFDKSAGFIVSVMADLESGEAKLVDRDLTVSGTVAKPADAAKVASLLKTSLPTGLALKALEISQPPVIAPLPPASYTWSAAIAPGLLTLEGNYPDEKSHQEIAEWAARLFQGVKVADRMSEARGAARSFMPAVSAALEQLSRMESGSASISDQSLTLKGDAVLESAVDRINSGFSNVLPAGWSGGSTVNVRPPQALVTAPACQQLLRDLLKSGTIYFENGKSEIDKDAFGLLDRLTATVKRCPDAQIEIAGHTDNDGSVAFNQDLSERRAYSVVDYLIRNGSVDSSRLRAAGYGFAKPVASNDTEEGKARNRRIEFSVK